MTISEDELYFTEKIWIIKVVSSLHKLNDCYLFLLLELSIYSNKNYQKDSNSFSRI